MPTSTGPAPTIIQLQLTRDAYPVVVGQRLLPHIGSWLQQFGVAKAKQRIAVVSDSNVAPLYADQVIASLNDAGMPAELITFPAGEASKSMEQAAQLVSAMLQKGFDRHSLLVALGGGVVGDLAGFVAAIFQRGIPYVQVPTTIVSQVDSSVGGKTGVNTPEGKNLAGSFHQPVLVLADTDTLASLPDREYNEGFAEIIKHAAIRDVNLLDLCETPDKSSAALEALISRNVMIKASIVEADEKETLGIRALLNFGHTIGHGIEAAGGYGGFLHGEAISLGLVAALRLSVETGHLSEADSARVIRALELYQLPTQLSETISDETILVAMTRDKKFEAGSIRFVLLQGLGDAFVSSAIDEAAIRRAITRLRQAP